MLKDRSPPYVRLSDGDIRNGYTLKLVNKSGEAREMSLEANGIDGLQLEVIGLEATEAGRIFLPVAAHGVDRYRIFVTVPQETAGGRDHFTLLLQDTATGELHGNRTSFMAPGD